MNTLNLDAVLVPLSNLQQILRTLLKDFPMTPNFHTVDCTLATFLKFHESWQKLGQVGELPRIYFDPIMIIWYNSLHKAIRSRPLMLHGTCWNRVDVNPTWENDQSADWLFDPQVIFIMILWHQQPSNKHEI